MAAIVRIRYSVVFDVEVLKASHRSLITCVGSTQT